MNQSQLSIILIALIFCIVFSAFFSLSETSLIAINRYRLRHQARLRDPRAMLILKLLKHPDRLLSGILIGNTFANILASSLTTILALELWGENGAVLAAILLTFVILIFAEIAPKTFAATHPDQLAKGVATPIHLFIRLGYPLIWLANTTANSLLKLFNVHVHNTTHQPLEQEELRSLVYEAAGKMPKDHQAMLINILDLNQLDVDDVMTPINHTVAIDIDAPWEKIVSHLTHSRAQYLPIYKGNRNQLLGVLHIEQLLPFIFSSIPLSLERLIALLHKPKFIPSRSPLRKQMLRFQQHNQRIVFVVDEYGDILGSLTLNDIFEEIAGHYSSPSFSEKSLIQAQQDGFIIDGSLSVRDFNRVTGWHLPVGGAKTISGIITEQMGILPKPTVCTLIQGHPVEVLTVENNRVKSAKIFPALKYEHHSLEH